LHWRGDLITFLTYLFLSSDWFSFYNDILINAGHDFGLCITLEVFLKRYAYTTFVTQKSFAFKERRKQELKEIGRACGMPEVVECQPSKCENLTSSPSTTPFKNVLALELLCLH
jgi:hypothetical protein